MNTPKNTNTYKEASSKGTSVNQSSPSILNFFDPVTGKRIKRKIPDTAPEKDEKDNKVKKRNEKGNEYGSFERMAITGCALWGSGTGLCLLDNEINSNTILGYDDDSMM